MARQMTKPSQYICADCGAAGNIVIYFHSEIQ